MLKILKSSVRDTFIYSIGTFSSKLAGFILVPLYTNKKYLSEVDYGVLNLIEANLQIIISVFGLGLCYAYERWYWDAGYIHKRHSILFTILFATTILSVFLVASLSPFSDFFSAVLLESSAYGYIFQLMLINAGLEIMAQTPNSLIRLNEKPTLYTFANIGKLMVSISLTVYFVAYRNMGLSGVYYAQIVGILVYFIILFRFIVSRLEIRFEWKILREMVQFRFPFLLPIIALNVFAFNDRFVLANLIGVVEAGVYSLGAKLANTIKVFVITAIWLALTPTIYKMMNDPYHKRFYSKVMTYLSFTVLIFVMFFSFYSKELVTFFATEEIYVAAYKVIPIISLGIFFSLLKDISMIGLNITKKTSSIAYTTLLASGVNLMLNFLLIPYIGIMGAAFASLSAQLIFFLIVYAIAQKHYSIPYEIKKVFLMIALSLGLYFASLISDTFHLWVRIPFKFFLICSFPIILYIIGFYEPVELERIKGFWIKWRNPMLWKKNITTLKF